jgi:CheY-like chemotaxis protein
MAHEINNPISLIMFNLPIIRRVWEDVLPAIQNTASMPADRRFGGYTVEFLQNRLGQLIADMEMAANRVSKIVRDLKDFSRQSPLADQTPMALNTAVENAVRLASATVRKSGTALDLALAPSLPAIIANLPSIEQILLNMLINAVQAIEHKQGRIRIQTGWDPETRKVYAAVTDNGKGVSAEIADKLFDPFVSDKQKQGGTGLGLAVSYNLARAHGGTIQFEAAAGGGTTFTLALPTDTRPRIPRILVVDDDPQVRQLMLQALARTRRYRVDEAANGVEGLIKIGAAPPDLLVLDLMMPGMNGLAVCQAVQKNPLLATMRVLITTGHPRHADLQQIAALGYEDIHPKPISPAAFIRKIDAIMAPSP